MKSKTSLVFLIGLTVALLLIAGSAVLLVTSTRKVGAVKTKLAAKRKDLDRAYQRDPFPSEENVERVLGNSAKLKEWNQTLVTRASQGQTQLEERSPSTFMALLGQTQRELIHTAKDPGRLPTEFAFSFDRYFGAGSKLPTPEHVPRLTQQLKIVEGLCNVLFAEGVTHVHSIQREEFEGLDNAPVGTATERNLENETAGQLAEGAQFGKFHFILAFQAREATLLNILNRLARHDLFIVVTRVEIKKEAEDVRPVVRPEAEEPVAVSAIPGAPGAPGTTGVTPAMAALAATEALRSREGRIISGIAVEQPMLITLELDVYHFRGGAQ